MKIAIVTDSTAYLREEYRNHPNLRILSVPLIIDGVTYQEGIDISDETFYDKLKEAQEFPKTSQPALGEVYDLYNQLADEGYEAIISIHLSSGISGFINTLNMVSTEFTNIKVYPFDSLITSGPMGKMVECALELSAQGVSAEDIIKNITQIRNQSEGFIVVDDLNHLVRGGRLKNGAAIIGTLLKIKPILKFEQGDIVLSEKIRSQKKALVRLQDIILNDLPNRPAENTFYVIHCNNPMVAQGVKDTLLDLHPSLDVVLCDFGPVIGTHLGEKSIGIGVAPKIG